VQQLYINKQKYELQCPPKDSLPPKSFSVIKAQVEFELGRPLSSVFSHVDEKPLACASIAQVWHHCKPESRNMYLIVNCTEDEDGITAWRCTFVVILSTVFPLIHHGLQTFDVHE
jgi:ABC1 atypical kinase-like domain